MNSADHARRIVAALDSDIATRVARSPREALQQDFGLTVQEVPNLTDRRGAEGWCDGLSFLDHDVVLIVPTPYSRRENFTAVHELAHRLVLNDDGALDWLANQRDPDRSCEAMCDQIAARLLLPGSLVAAVVKSEPPNASHIAELYRLSEASEPVCAIALSDLLPCQGAVLISDIGGSTVTYASVHATDEDGWPLAYPWPRRLIPKGHPLLRIRPTEERRERSWWATPWGDRQNYYLDAVAHSRRVHCVLAVYDLWGASRLHVGDVPQKAARPERTLACACGYNDIARGFPCSDCGQPYCPQCKECRCQRQERRLVDCPNPGCFMKVLPTQIRGQRCVNCE
jgi:Zn-dependent peptidase ImmA (M78 family)